MTPKICICKTCNQPFYLPGPIHQCPGLAPKEPPLDRVIAAVERGEWLGQFALDVLGPENGQRAYGAMYGDLNAAQDMQAATLPGTLLGTLQQEPHTASGWMAELRGGPDLKTIAQAFDQPRASRAWLLAILRALRDRANNSMSRQ